MNDEQWVVIPNWDKFQHYKDRDPAWIKLYLRLLRDVDYLSLTPTARALLHGLWLLYGACDGRVPRSTVGVALQLKAKREHWESLSDAGFIEFSASKPLALARSRETEKRKKELKRPVENQEPEPELLNFTEYLSTIVAGHL
jgi:hypothetical protein